MKLNGDSVLKTNRLPLFLFLLKHCLSKLRKECNLLEMSVG